MHLPCIIRIIRLGTNEPKFFAHICSFGFSLFYYRTVVVVVVVLHTPTSVIVPVPNVKDTESLTAQTVVTDSLDKGPVNVYSPVLQSIYLATLPVTFVCISYTAQGVRVVVVVVVELVELVDVVVQQAA
jgi:hypothetical protein